MKRFWILKGLKLLAFLIVALGVLGCAVMALWNWVLPPVTGLHAISFAQALALLVLARLLFGSFRGRRTDDARGARALPRGTRDPRSMLRAQSGPGPVGRSGALSSPRLTLR